MSAQDVVIGGLRGLEFVEVACAPGVEWSDLLRAVFDADLGVFGAQSPALAEHYRTAAAG
jgi:hypothetical protein